VKCHPGAAPVNHLCMKRRARCSGLFCGAHKDACGSLGHALVSAYLSTLGSPWRRRAARQNTEFMLSKLRAELHISDDRHLQLRQCVVDGDEQPWRRCAPNPASALALPARYRYAAFATGEWYPYA